MGPGIMRFSSPRPLVENSWESWVFKGAGGSYGTPYSFETGTICTDKCTGKHDAASGILGVNDGTGEQHPGVTLVGAVACGGSNSPCHGGHYGQGFAVRASLSVFVALRLSPHVPLPDRPTNRALLSLAFPSRQPLTSSTVNAVACLGLSKPDRRLDHLPPLRL